jgi:Spy/CpxP family protein refolding chaperone
MKRTFNFRLWMLVMTVGAALVLPAAGLAKEKMEGMHHQEWKARLAKELKLTPEAEKKFMAVAEKYDKSRKDIFEELKKSQGELQNALAAAKPDEAKVKDLVKNITASQDKLLSTFKEERDAEMALLSPMDQGSYLQILHKWRQEMYEKHMKGEPPKGEMEKQAGPEKK